MTSKVVIITPEASPGAGGLADHTLALVRRWQSVSRVELLVRAPPPSAVPAVENVTSLERSRSAIAAQLPSNGKILVQYSAYGFDSIGYPRQLIGALIDWKKRTSGRLVILFHEIWTFWPVTNKNFVIQELHRRALKRLLGVCDAVFTTTSSQEDHLRKLSATARVEVLPVGSNIARYAAVQSTRESGRAVLFGLQRSRIATLKQMTRSLTDLASARQIRRIISIGQGSDERLRDRERELLSRLKLTEGFQQEGPLSEEKVSEHLAAAWFGLFGQSELSLTKSGSFMAYAAHGMNVIADFADSSKPPPVSWLVAPKELVTGISTDELARRRECLRLWQELNGSWDTIANRLGYALGIRADRPEKP